MEKIKWLETFVQAVIVLLGVKFLGTFVAGLYPPLMGFGSTWGLPVSGIIVVGAGIIVGKMLAEKLKMNK